jgi:Reverse transcriptase (RNA-dependent DNA polymerase)
MSADRSPRSADSIQHASLGTQRVSFSQTSERPNSDASFAISTVDAELLPTSTANGLQAFGISELLSTYPNRRFVDTLLSIALHGARIGFEGQPSGRVQRRNHSTAFVHPQTISESIRREIEKGRVKEISSLPINSFCSPIGLVPKSTNGVQTGWRIIFDLSSPEGSSVNDGIPKQYGTIAYKSLNDAICLVAQAGKGAVMMKRDLKAAFRHVPINPCDYWLLRFEWDGKFYVDMFLPFGLRTAPRIFNLFAEALHWVFETLFEWNCTHYLDDFLFVFPTGTDISSVSAEFDSILAKFGLSKASEKDSNGCIVIHLGFEFDSTNMQVRLPQPKKQRALDSVNSLLSSSSVLLTDLESTLGFLSHCCQVVPLGRPFLRHLFSLLCHHGNRRPSSKTRLSSDARNDLRWWHRFLVSWSSISMIQISRRFCDVATDASGGKGIGGVYRRIVFSERIPWRHKLQRIDWKELFAILHTFLLWHEEWQGATVRLACDNSGVVDAINKHSIQGPAILPLQRLFLIAAVYDIEIVPFWVPSEENMVIADAASRYDHERLANLGLQVSQLPRPSDLRRRLSSFFATPSQQALSATTRKSSKNTRPSAGDLDIPPSHPHSRQPLTGSLILCPPSGQPPLKAILAPSEPSISWQGSIPLESTTLVSPSYSRVGSEFTVKAPRESGIPLRTTSSSTWSVRSTTTKKGSTSKRLSVWHLPPSFDLETLHGIHGPQARISPILPGNTSLSIPRS